MSNLMHNEYTSSHLISEIQGFRESSSTNGMKVAVNCTEKFKIILESRRGMFQSRQLMPSGQLHVDMKVGQSMLQRSTWEALDSYPEVDWEFCKSRVVGTDALNHLKKLRQATELCMAALNFHPSDGRRKAHVDQALSISPELCTLAHYLKYELAAFQDFDFKDAENVDKLLGHLDDAVKAGKRAAEMLRAGDFCPGRFYDWMPTRMLVRSTFLIGAVNLCAGRLDAADQALKACLSLDNGDHLGARHKQLLAVLERDGVTGDEVEWLLSAKFGEEKNKDKVYALFNYTRALRAFSMKGNCRKSRALLEHAIETNSAVPPVLLAWDNVKENGHFMVLGTESEASDYCEGNSHFWYETEGSLDWLEEIYCKQHKLEPLTDQPEIRLNLVQATRFIEDSSLPLHSQERKHVKQQAIEKLKRIEDLMDNHTSNRLKRIVYQRKGLCYAELFEFVQALPQFNSALSLCDPVKDKDLIKELLYNRANCKEQAGDLRGALADYTFVYQRIGKFSTAVEGIRTLEEKLGAAFSVLPHRPPPFPDAGVDGNVAAMEQTMSELAKCLPPINLVEQQRSKERCAHCQRSGIKLAMCGNCQKVRFCSKQCQTVSWRAIHKYVCEGSKSRIEIGSTVTIHSLLAAPQHNGKQGIVAAFLADKARFAVTLEAENGVTKKLSVKPQNLLKVD